jgi:hypothetical protein
MQKPGGRVRLPWDRLDLFFLSDALARRMPIKDLAGFLNGSEEEVRERASLRGQDFCSSDSASESHRHSTENKSTFSAASAAPRAKRRTSAARLRHSDLS